MRSSRLPRLGAAALSVFLVGCPDYETAPFARILGATIQPEAGGELLTICVSVQNRHPLLMHPDRLHGSVQLDGFPLALSGAGDATNEAKTPVWNFQTGAIAMVLHIPGPSSHREGDALLLDVQLASDVDACECDAIGAGRAIRHSEVPIHFEGKLQSRASLICPGAVSIAPSGAGSP